MLGLAACQSTAKNPDVAVTSATTPPTAIDSRQQDSERLASAQQGALFNQAVESIKQGRTELALQLFNEVVASNPATPRAYTNIGLLYLHKQDNESAKQAFTQAIEQDKKDAVAYNHLAVIQRQEGLFKLALFNYYKAIDADPDYANARLNLGILLDVYLQDLPKALQQYEKYQQLTSSNEEVDKWVIDIKRRIEATETEGR